MFCIVLCQHFAAITSVCQATYGGGGGGGGGGSSGSGIRCHCLIFSRMHPVLPICYVVSMLRLFLRQQSHVRALSSAAGLQLKNVCDP